jgi:hypothetical protein
MLTVLGNFSVNKMVPILKNWASILIILLVINIAQLIETEEKLRFVTKMGKITVAQDVDKTYLTVTVLANDTFATIQQHINEINETIHKPLSIAGLITDEPLQRSFYDMLYPGDAALTQISEDAYLISQYNDPSQPSNPKYTCHAIFGAPHVLHFTEVHNHINWLLQGINMAWATADLKKSPAREALNDFLHDSKVEVVNLAELIQSRLLILDELTAGNIPNELLTFLQQRLECYPIGKFEKVTLQKCTKVEVGLQCNLELTVFGTTHDHNQLIPINYNGIEISIGKENDILVELSTNQLAVLSCSTVSTESVHLCTHTDYDNDCSIALVNHDITGAANSCNFTFKDPPLPLKLDSGGVIVMDKKYTIQTTKNNQVTTIENTSPLLIFTKSILSFLYKTEILNFQPSQDIAVEKIIFSAINSTVINIMKLKALKQAVLNWDFYSILQYAALTVHVAIFPVALVSCCVSLKAMKSFKPLKRSILTLKRSHEKAKDPVVKRANYIHNKRYSR